MCRILQQTDYRLAIILFKIRLNFISIHELVMAKLFHRRCQPDRPDDRKSRQYYCAPEADQIKYGEKVKWRDTHPKGGRATAHPIS
jgi:hypothetical protein